MQNKVLQSFLRGFLSCFKFVPPVCWRGKGLDKSWYDNWINIARDFETGFKKLEKEYERN